MTEPSTEPPLKETSDFTDWLTALMIDKPASRKRCVTERETRKVKGVHQQEGRVRLQLPVRAGTALCRAAVPGAAVAFMLLRASGALAAEAEPQVPIAAKHYDECALIIEDYRPILEQLQTARSKLPMKGKQVHTGPCCLEYLGEAAKGLCQIFESRRDASETWYCAANRQKAAYAKCRQQVSDYMKRVTYEKAFASVSKRLDSAKSSEDIIWAAVEWRLARQRYFGPPAEAAPDELEDFRQAVFDEIVDPVKERPRDAALWMLGRQLAKRYPNLAVNGAMVLEAIGRATQRIAPLMTVIDALRPSSVATDDQEMMMLDAAIRRKLQERLGRHLLLAPPPRLVPPQIGPILRDPR